MAFEPDFIDYTLRVFLCHDWLKRHTGQWIAWGNSPLVTPECSRYCHIVTIITAVTELLGIKKKKGFAWWDCALEAAVRV